MGRLLDRIRNRPAVPAVRELIGQGLDIVDQVATDKDALNKLKYTLAQAQAQLMMSGPGQSITKITICVLVSLVVGSGTWVFITCGDMLSFRDYALAVVPIISILTGSYVTGTSFKRSKWSKDE
jgi:hypothetical protein